MSQRIVLLGASVGPWCSIDMVRHPVLRVSGLRRGRIVAEIITKESSVPFVMDCDSNGEYPFVAHSQVMFDAKPAWILVRLLDDEPTSKLVCTVFSKKAA